MTDLAPCPACRRHVRVDETACPFCASALATAEPRSRSRGRLSRAAVFAGAALVTTAAGCGGKAKPADTNLENASIDAGPGDEPVAPDAAPVVDDDGPDYDNNIPMPYGAPPVRERLV